MTTANQTIAKTYRQPLAWPQLKVDSTILQRLNSHDKTAIEDCFDTYGGKIRALAKKFTRSGQEAEVVTEEIFQDIWIYAASDHGEDVDPIEDRVITRIAIRRLLKHQWEGRDIF